MAKKVAPVVLAVMIALCATSAFAGGTKEASTATGPVKLSWYFWTGSQAEVDFWNTIGKRVTAKYPDIALDFITDGWVAYWNKLQLMIASGGTADVMGLQFQRSLGYGPAYLPLDPYLAKNPGMTDDFDNTILPALRYQGKQLALPYDFGPDMIFINKDLFDKHHVPYPANNWTMADFIKTCAALSGDGEYGFSFSSYLDFIIPFILSYGGRYLDASGRYVLTDPGTVRAVTMIRDMVKQGSAVPFVATNNTEWHSENWTGGAAAMHVNGPWMIINFLTSVKFKVGIANIPAGPAGAATVTAGSGFGIGKDSKHPDEAFKAIAEITSKDSLIMVAQAGRGFPGRKSAQSAFFNGDNGVPASWQPIMNSLISGAKPFLITQTWNQATELIFRSLIPIFNGEVPVEQGLKDLEQRLNALK
jgi:multiple sugar transport system substrate-binding protein